LIKDTEEAAKEVQKKCADQATVLKKEIDQAEKDVQTCNDDATVMKKEMQEAAKDDQKKCEDEATVLKKETEKAAKDVQKKCADEATVMKKEIQKAEQDVKKCNDDATVMKKENANSVKKIIKKCNDIIKNVKKKYDKEASRLKKKIGKHDEQIDIMKAKHKIAVKEASESAGSSSEIYAALQTKFEEAEILYEEKLADEEKKCDARVEKVIIYTKKKATRELAAQCVPICQDKIREQKTAERKKCSSKIK